ncbi:MAG: hypothetical protein KGZ79_01845 [Dethiobacter sp.]|jgi:hypothetical protein|nr:hypothetical protein [Dethiobacter sp.]
MREQVKTYVLLGLVLSSITLTSRLLFGLPMMETVKPSSFEQLVFGELRPVSRQVLPELRLQEKGEFRVIKPWEQNHASVWESVQQLIFYSQVPALAEAPPAETNGLRLWAVFPVSIPPSVWGGSQRLVGLEISDMVWLKSDPQFVWYHDIKDGWLKARLMVLSDEWEFAISSAFAEASLYRFLEAGVLEKLGLSAQGEILLPAEAPVLASRLVGSESLDRDKLVRSIFVDTALVRQIEERDGAFIYTDGHKGLRLFAHGEVEFSAPSSEPGSEMMETIPALRRTAQYLQLMGGWQDHLYLNHLVREESFLFSRRQWDSYLVSFISVQHGTRLVSANPPVKLRFSDRGIIYYKRQVRTLTTTVEEQRPLIEPLDALQTVAQLLDEDDKSHALTEIFPAYFLHSAAGLSSVAPPVWVILFNNNRAAVIHGQTGIFMAWLE